MNYIKVAIPVVGVSFTRHVYSYMTRAATPFFNWLLDKKDWILWGSLGVNVVYLIKKAATKRGQMKVLNAEERVYNDILQHWWTFSFPTIKGLITKNLSENMRVILFTWDDAPPKVTSVTAEMISPTEVAIGGDFYIATRNFKLVIETYWSQVTIENPVLLGTVQVILYYSLDVSLPHVSRVKLRFTEVNDFDFHIQISGLANIAPASAESRVRQRVIGQLMTGINIDLTTSRSNSLR